MFSESKVELTIFDKFRSINYLKYGIVYPSFGVDQEDILGDV